MSRLLLLIISVIVSCLCSNNLSSQQVINGNSFVQKALAQSIENPTQTYEKFRNPWINKIDFRTESSDFKLREQEYTLRISPSSRSKRKAQNNYYEALTDAPNFENIALKTKYLEQVYSDWVELYFLDIKEDLINEIKEIHTDKRTILQKYQSALEYDFQQMINLETATTNLKNDQQKLFVQKNSILDKYTISTQDSLIFGNFIDLDQVLLKMQSPVSYQSDLANSYKQNLLQKELLIEKMEQREILDFAQIRYKGPHDDGLNERISVGLGFKLNTSGDKQLKMRELEYRIKEIDEENRLDTKKANQKTEASKKTLQEQIKYYQYVQSNLDIERVNLQNIANQIQKKEGFDPMVLIKIEERHIVGKLDQLSLLEDIYKNYLDYLVEAQLISETTMEDYLRNN